MNFQRYVILWFPSGNTKTLGCLQQRVPGLETQLSSTQDGEDFLQNTQIKNMSVV